MNANEQKKFGALVCGLFPLAVTQEQSRLLQDQAAKLPFDIAAKAVQQYRATHDSFKLSELIAELDAVAKQEEASSSAARREGTWIEIQRRNWAPKLDNASNLEVILRVKRAEWNHPKCSHSTGMREGIGKSAASLIVRFCGVSSTEAERLAENIFAEDFQSVLDEIRKLQPASSCA